MLAAWEIGPLFLEVFEKFTGDCVVVAFDVVLWPGVGPDVSNIHGPLVDTFVFAFGELAADASEIAWCIGLSCVFADVKCPVKVGWLYFDEKLANWTALQFVHDVRAELGLELVHLIL